MEHYINFENQEMLDEEKSSLLIHFYNIEEFIEGKVSVSRSCGRFIIKLL